MHKEIEGGAGMKARIIVALVALSVMVSLGGCGGGGGINSAVPPTQQTGGIEGYAYVPIGGAARTANAPAGYGTASCIAMLMVGCGGWVNV